MLVLCSACSRHVKSMPCPFCGGAKSVGVRPAPISRLSRAQLLAGAALVSVVGAGCSSDDTPGDDDDDKTSSSSGGSAQPVYGAPVVDDAGTDAGSSGLAPAYGAPADGGFTTSSSGGTSGAAPAYGAPPGDSGTL